MLGTNGNLDPDVNADNKRNAAYKDLVTLLKTAAPDAKIVILAPPRVTENPAYSNYDKNVIKYVLMRRSLQRLLRKATDTHLSTWAPVKIFPLQPRQNIRQTTDFTLSVRGICVLHSSLATDLNIYCKGISGNFNDMHLQKRLTSGVISNFTAFFTV